MTKHTVVLGVTGGIAAYKAAEIASGLTKKGYDVTVVMTEHACRFVMPLTFETLTKNAVITFQRLFGLPVNGVVGAQTWNAVAQQYDYLIETENL